MGGGADPLHPFDEPSIPPWYPRCRGRSCRLMRPWPSASRSRRSRARSASACRGWLHEGAAKAFAANTARLAIVGDDPMLLSAQDPAKVARANKANSVAYQPALEKIANFDINWNIVAFPGAAWARQVFKDDAEEIAVARLAEAIFAASRVDRDDPRHDDQLSLGERHRQGEGQLHRLQCATAAPGDRGRPVSAQWLRALRHGRGARRVSLERRGEHARDGQQRRIRADLLDLDQ